MTEQEYRDDVLAFLAMDDELNNGSRTRPAQLQIGARLLARFLYNVETIARAQSILSGIKERPGFLNGSGKSEGKEA